MEHLETGLTVFGAFMAACVLLVGLLWGAAALWISIDCRRVRFRREGAERERAMLAGDARWFSEDPETMRLLEDFARDPDVSAVRERWRRRRRSACGERGPIGNLCTLMPGHSGAHVATLGRRDPAENIAETWPPSEPCSREAGVTPDPAGPTALCHAGQHERCAGWHTALAPYGPCGCECHGERRAEP